MKRTVITMYWDKSYVKVMHGIFTILNMGFPLGGLILNFCLPPFFSSPHVPPLTLLWLSLDDFSVPCFVSVFVSCEFRSVSISSWCPAWCPFINTVPSHLLDCLGICHSNPLSSLLYHLCSSLESEQIHFNSLE